MSTEESYEKRLFERSYCVSAKQIDSSRHVHGLDHRMEDACVRFLDECAQTLDGFVSPVRIEEHLGVA
jgi:hypothetical protein